MEKHEEALLELLARGLFGSSRGFEFQGTDWARVFLDSGLHAVTALALDGAEGLHDLIPPPVLETWKEAAIGTLARNARVGDRQRELVRLLEREGIPFMVIKGEAAACWYRRPELRTLGDVDFLIRWEDVERTETLLESNGYERLRQEFSWHRVYLKDGTSLEAHVRPSGVPEGGVGEAIGLCFSRALENPEWVTADGAAFPVLSAPFHGLVLLLHVQHHLKAEGVGLRHLCDWAAFMGKLDGETWEMELEPALKLFGLKRFADVLTGICKRYLGLKGEEAQGSADPQLGDAVLAAILKGGNFGVKDREQTRLASGLLSHGGTPGKRMLSAHAFLALRQHARTAWPGCARNPLLRAWAFVYLPLRYLARAAAGKRGTPRLLLTVRQASRRKKLYEELRLFEP